MKKYINLRNMVFNQPHLCTPEYAETVLAVLSDKLGLEEGAFEIHGEPKDKRDSKIDVNGVYTLPIVGSMVHRGGMMDAMSGTMSYEGIQTEIQAALDNPKVKSILLDVDSSGGAVAGAFDLRDFILQAKEQKPIYALARDSMCSAAYLISSAATKVYATQTASVGSIGVVAMHVDESERNEKAGVKPTFIYAGKFKTAGNSNEALEGEALSYLQESVNDSYDMFVKAVADARGIDEKIIRDTEARVYKGQKAKSLGLVDGVRAMRTVYKELADVSQKRVITQTMSNKGQSMDNVDVEKLEADLAQAVADASTAKANVETLQAAIIAEGYTISENGLQKAKEPEMIEVAGVMTDKATLPEHVVKALEAAAEERADHALTELAGKELPNFKMDDAKALLKVFADDEGILKALKAADAAMAGLMDEIGKTDETADFTDPKDKFEALVKAHVEKGMTKEEARAKVTESAEGLALIKAAKE